MLIVHALNCRFIARDCPFATALAAFVSVTRHSQKLCLFTIVVCAVVIYLYPLALPTPLLDPDEGIHARIAQEMVERGDYLVPTFCGTPFRDKPVLFSAAQALSLRTFGMTEAAVRLPGVLFALLGTVTTVLLSRRLFDPQAALYTALASLTLALPGILAQSPAHDIALVPWTNLIVLTFWEMQHCDDRRRHWRWALAMSVCIALAMLTKGLIGIAVIVAGLGLYTIVSRTLSVRLVTHCTVALVCGSLLASPWFLLMEHASPGYLYYYFVERHLFGYVTEGQEHGHAAWYYYIGPVLGGAMPWLIFAGAAVLQPRYNRNKPIGRPILLLVCWFVGGFLFLSLANSKLLTYSLPIFPPLAILSGVVFRDFFRGELAPAACQVFVTTFRLTAAAGIVGPVLVLLFLDRFLAAPSPPPAYALAVLASVLMAVEWFQFERHQGRTGAAIGMLWFPIVFASVMTWPVQPLAEQYSQRALAALLAAEGGNSDQVVFYGQRVGSVLFYLPPEKSTWLAEGRIHEADSNELKTLIPPPSGTVIAITNKELRRCKWLATIRQQAPRPAGAFNVIAGRAGEVHVAKQPTRAVQ